MQRHDPFQDIVLRSNKRQKKTASGSSNMAGNNSAVSKQEQKLIYQALQNSLIESESMTERLSMIEEMPVFHPTEEEF